jgi:hypothetical protein
MPPAGAAAGGDPLGGTDPGAGSDAGDTGGGDEVVVTITKTADGSYMVYAGDEPDDGGGADLSSDDADAMGAAGGAPAGGAAGGAAGGGGAMGGDMGGASGQPADSIGAALKLAMDILKDDESSAGADGSADDQFNAGFSGAPAPGGGAGGMAQKY